MARPKLKEWLGPIITLAVLFGSGLIAYGMMKSKLAAQATTDTEQNSEIDKVELRSVRRDEAQDVDIKKAEELATQNRQDIAVQTALMEDMAGNVKEILVEARKPRGPFNRGQ